MPSIRTTEPGATPETFTGMDRSVSEMKPGMPDGLPRDSAIGGMVNWAGESFVARSG